MSAEDATPYALATPGVTVVVACYNHAAFLEQALQSVFDQNHDVRVIVTDDASTDNTRDVIEATLRRHGRDCKRVYHVTNRGICATFNEALALVETPFVAFLSGDDWCREDRLSVQVPILEQAGPSCALVYSDMELVDEAGRSTGRRYTEVLPGGWPVGRDERAFERLLKDGNWIPAPSVLARTDALRAVGGFDETLPYEDYDMWLRLSRRYTFAASTEALVCYRTHPGQLSAAVRAAHSRVFVTARIRTLLKHFGTSAGMDDWLTNEVFRLGVQAYRGGMPAKDAVALFRMHVRRFHRPRSYLYLLLARAGARGSLITTVQARVRRRAPVTHEVPAGSPR